MIHIYICIYIDMYVYIYIYIYVYVIHYTVHERGDEANGGRLCSRFVLGNFGYVVYTFTTSML